MKNTSDTAKLSPLEAEVVMHLRMMSQHGREMTRAVTEMHAEHFAARPVLRLVMTPIGGRK